MAKYVVDTDIFIDHLRVGVRVPTAPEDSAYSSITRAELYAGRNTDEDVVDVLLGPFEELVIDRVIAETGGRIRRRLQLSMPDALIAATAIETGRTLLTRNAKHFRAVEGLRLRVPKTRG
jgi:hypothetical protein